MDGFEDKHIKPRLTKKTLQSKGSTTPEHDLFGAHLDLRNALGRKSINTDSSHPGGPDRQVNKMWKATGG